MAEPFKYEVEHQGRENIIIVNAETLPYVPSLEDSEIVMEKTVEILLEIKNATRIQFKQKRDYEYDFPQMQLLQEIADLYEHLVRNKELYSFQHLSFGVRGVDSESR